MGNIYFVTEEARKFDEEFSLCETIEEIMELEEREREKYESCGNTEIPHHDMTLEEFRAKYHTISHEDLMKKYGFDCTDK